MTARTSALTVQTALGIRQLRQTSGARTTAIRLIKGKKVQGRCYISVHRRSAAIHNDGYSFKIYKIGRAHV